jgi:hypothetical protein
VSNIANYSCCHRYVPNNDMKSTVENPPGPLYKGGTKYRKKWPDRSLSSQEKRKGGDDKYLLTLPYYLIYISSRLI